MNLKKLRKESGKTQKQIADVLGLTTVGYNGYETQKREPNIKVLTKLADFYGVSLDYLVGREFKNDLGFLTKKQYEAFKTFLELSEENQNIAFGYISSLNENNNKNK